MNNSPNERHLSRRDLIARTGLVAGAFAVAAQVRGEDTPTTAGRVGGFKFSLNTATIQGQKLPLPEEVEIAATAGYHAIEPWVEEIRRYVAGGGKAADLKKRIADLGLIVPSAIGFADWIDNDDARRAAGLEQWKRDADLVRSIGGFRMAAPPSGAYNTALDLRVVADRYRHLLEISGRMGIVPELEMWGGSKTLTRMSHVAFVLVEVAHPDACGLLDIFHIFKGGSPFGGVRIFNGAALHVLHVNDYPAGLTRDKGNDSDRVYPGDGSAPIVTMLRDLHAIGYNGMLSVELFNRGYWKQDALVVARTGREKIQALVERAMARTGD